MHIHIIGIAGQGMTTPLAVELKRQGHKISGTDQEKIYFPASAILRQSRIKINSPHPQPDLVIVGSSYAKNPHLVKEFEQIKESGLSYIPATKYIAQNLIKDKSILVAGTYGKTTITALVSWILIKAGFDPSYLIGGQPINRIPPLKISPSDWSVIEADESINGLDTKAKFLYYPANFVILTSADWEHKDSYLTEKDNLLAFKTLISQIPPNGILVYNPNNHNILKILDSCKAKKIPYDFSLKFKTSLIGQHNLENITAAFTLCHYLGLEDSLIKNAIKTFKGISLRLEITKKINNILFIDDFAQSAQRVKVAIDSLCQHFPNRPIKVYFEPHAHFLQYFQSIPPFQQAFAKATEIILGKLNFNSKISRENRVTASTFTNLDSKIKYLPLPSQIINYFSRNLKSGDILIHFSSGGQLGQLTFKSIINSIPPKNV